VRQTLLHSGEITWADARVNLCGCFVARMSSICDLIHGVLHFVGFRATAPQTVGVRARERHTASSRALTLAQIKR
jgi:hypothetical protein